MVIEHYMDLRTDPSSRWRSDGGHPTTTTWTYKIGEDGALIEESPLVENLFLLLSFKMLILGVEKFIRLGFSLCKKIDA